MTRAARRVSRSARRAPNDSGLGLRLLLLLRLRLLRLLRRSRLLLLSGLDLDLLRLLLGPLRNRQREHTVSELRAHVVGVDAFGQGERARERAIRALVREEAVALLA